MREILFRGKSVDTGEWLYGDLTHIGNSDRAQIWVLNEDGGRDNYLVYADTVGQYTRLTDKKGRKIFEGDIVSGRAYSQEFRGVIVWIDQIASFGLRTGHDIAAQNCTILDRANRGMNDEFSAEIIGNIYDNPELWEALK